MFKKAVEAPTRKAFPLGELPMELWRIILDYSRVWDKQNIGIGFNINDAFPRPALFLQWLQYFIASIFTTGYAPGCWHLVDSCHIDKFNGKTGPKGRRLLFLESPLAKTFYKTLYKDRCKTPTLLDGSFGCLKGRSRDEAIAIVNITGQRAGLAGIGYIQEYYDSANAFLSVSKQEIEKAIDSIFIEGSDVRFTLLIKQHIIDCIFTISGCDGQISLRPGSGIFPGFTIASDIFNIVMAKFAYKWIDRTRLTDTTFEILSPVSGITLDASVTIFVDDIAKVCGEID